MVVKGCRELAKELGLTISTIMKLQKKGILNPIKKDPGVSGAWYYDVSDSKMAYKRHIEKVITHKWRNIY